jgi:N-acetylneuraminate synthase/N,N'-diacetyllegionaminate synthase
VLFDYSKAKGIIAFSTPAYYDDVELLERLEVPAHKIGSDDLTNLPFLRYVAARNRPVIFSTGMAYLSEVDEAFRSIVSTGNEQVVILQCVSNYPIRDFRLVNLRVIESYRKAFNVPIGFSDHTTGHSAALGAVALGASVVEKHFTIDKKLEAPDAFFSADPAEMKALVTGVRELEQALGDSVKAPTAAEVNMRAETRKSVIARRTIHKGEALSADMLIIKRPGTGIAPKLQHVIVGRRAKHEIEADRPITLEMLE